MLALSLRGDAGSGPIENIADFSAALAETVLFGPSSANALVQADDDAGTDLIAVDYGDVGTVDFALAYEQKVELVVRGYRSVNDRLLACGHGGVQEGLPGWLRDMQAGAKEEARRRRGEQEAPDYDRHFLQLQESLDTFGAQFKQCVEGNGGFPGRCGIEGIRGAAGDEALRRAAGGLWAVVKADRRLLAALAVALVGAAAIFFLAALGWGVYRQARRAGKGKGKGGGKSKSKSS